MYEHGTLPALVSSITFVMVQGMSSVQPAIAVSPRSPDLAPQDWLEAGQSLLRRGGLRALKLRPLAEELKVSTGSFYHHFRDFDDYQGKLATYFAEDQVENLIAALERATDDSIARIRLLGQTVRRRGSSRRSRSLRWSVRRAASSRYASCSGPSLS